jgi:hypothetical protein
MRVIIPSPEKSEAETITEDEMKRFVSKTERAGTSESVSPRIEPLYTLLQQVITGATSCRHRRVRAIVIIHRYLSRFCVRERLSRSPPGY